MFDMIVRKGLIELSSHVNFNEAFATVLESSSKDSTELRMQCSDEADIIPKNCSPDKVFQALSNIFSNNVETKPKYEVLPNRLEVKATVLLNIAQAYYLAQQHNCSLIRVNTPSKELFDFLLEFGFEKEVVAGNFNFCCTKEIKLKPKNVRQ